MTLQQGRSGFAWGRLPLPATHVTGIGDGTVRPVASFASGLASEQDPYPYPGQRPNGSFVVMGDDVLPVHSEHGDWLITSDADGRTPLSTWLARREQAATEERTAVLAYGSNLNPDQIGVFAGGRAVVVLRVLTVGLAATFCTTKRHDGQYPAGLMGAEPDRVEVHGMLLLDKGQYAGLDAKEGGGVRYQLSRVSGIAAPVAAVLDDGRAIVDDIPAYVQMAARPLALVDGVPAHLSHWAQKDFATTGKTSTHEHGLAVEPARRAPNHQAKALPLFVYGTLRPGESRWPALRDMVERSEEASVMGRLFDTGRGYPALSLAGADEVPGMLLHLAPDAAVRAMREADSIEGHPQIYVRTLVRLNDRRLAWTYVWAAELRRAD